MANMYLVSASVIKWKIGKDGKAYFDSASPFREAIVEGSEDQIKLKILAGWLKTQSPNDIPGLLDKVIDGLLTVEIESRSPVKIPEIPA